MVTIKCRGGLGNQMFQYALYRTLLEMGKEAYLDIDEFDSCDSPRKWQIEEAFGLTIRRYRYPNYIKIPLSWAKLLWAKWPKPCVGHYLGSVLYRIVRMLSDHFEGSFKKYNDKQCLDIASYVKKGNYLLDGYWQSSNYFVTCEKRIREDFIFRKLDNFFALKILQEIDNSSSISVHFRRGDYIINKCYTKIYGGICTEKYYNEAITYISKHVTKPKYFIFTDDAEWAMNSTIVKYLENSIVVSTIGRPEWQDMFLMSRCKHNIIANSSYSWWAAWLNSNPNKITIAPSRWVNDYSLSNLSDLTGVFEKNWILINRDGLRVANKLEEN